MGYYDFLPPETQPYPNMLNAELGGPGGPGLPPGVSSMIMRDISVHPPRPGTGPGPRRPIPIPSVLPGMTTMAPGPSMPGVQVTPGGGYGAPPGAGPMSAPPPSAAPIPATPRPQSLWDRVQSILMPNTGMASLLDDDQLSSARKSGLLHMGLSMLANARGQGYGNAPSFGQALAGGVNAGEQAFQGNANQTVQGEMEAQQMAEYQRILKARAAIAQKYAPQPNETPGQTSDRLRAMAAEFARNGDQEMLKGIGGLNGEVFKDPRMEALLHGKEPIQIDLGSHKIVLDPYSLKQIGDLPKTPEGMSGDAKAYRDASIGMAQQNQQFQRESKLSDDFRNELQQSGIGPGARALQMARTMLPAAQAGNPQAQKALVMAFVKSINPTANARPGVALQMEDAQGIPDEIVKNFAKLTSGGAALSGRQIQSIASQLPGIEQNFRSNYAPVRAQYEARARRFGVDPGVLDDPFEAMPAARVTPSNPAGAGNAGNVRQFVPNR